VNIVKKIKILVVEEDHYRRRAIVNFFRENCNYEVSTATDNTGGMKAFVINFPDLVIADVDTKIEGVVRLAKRNNKMVVGIGSDNGLEKFWRAGGCCEFLTKPFHLLQLKSAIDRVITRNEWRFTIGR
jgi:DNA-binding NtrC family response regulator